MGNSSDPRTRRWDNPDQREAALYEAATRTSKPDPLAELARLIGQDDPFAEIGREHSRNEARPAHEPDRGAYAGHPGDGQHYDPNHDPTILPRDAGRAHQTHAYDEHAYQAPSYQAHSRHNAPDYDTDYGRQSAPPAHHDTRFYDHDQREYDARDERPQSRGYAAHAEGEVYDPRYDSQGYEADQDEPAPARKRGGMMIVGAVLGLALFGTAGAFAYRSISNGAPSTPPVIKAEPSPTKIIPAAQTDAQSNKLIHDRVAERSAGERVVSREEQPLDIRDPRIQTRAVQPNTGIPALISAGPPSVTAATGANAAAAGNEPKRVRTVPIKLDSGAGADPRLASAPQTGSRPVGSLPSPATRAVAPSAPTALAPQPGPLALNSPSAGPQLQSAASSPIASTARVGASEVRTASIAPNGGVPAPGSFVVQVSAQKSEADAQASYKLLQVKYPTVLGSRQALIRKADLGDKGIFYRAQIGPFGNAEEANEFCGSLRTAGGTCIVQRN